MFSIKPRNSLAIKRIFFRALSVPTVLYCLIFNTHALSEEDPNAVLDDTAKTTSVIQPSMASNQNIEVTRIKQLIKLNLLNDIDWLDETEQTPFIFREALNSDTKVTTNTAVITVTSTAKDFADIGTMSEIAKALPLAGRPTLHMLNPINFSRDIDSIDEPELDDLSKIPPKSVEIPDYLSSAGPKGITEAIEFIKGENIRWAMVVSDQYNAMSAIQACINNPETTTALILWKTQDLAFSQEVLNALSESRISVLEVLPNSISRETKLRRQLMFNKARFGKHYQITTIPDPEPSYEFSYKRIRAWIEKSFIE